ncbi:MAG: prepilin-type N-terminal cleavage/methylation domain-containing protein [Halieaceae bacterium]
MTRKAGMIHGKQAGFSLVEIAVVLVIIGLLIGGILQGTEMIDNSRIKKAATDYQAISTAYVAYQDRYQRLPGDDGALAVVTARGGDWARVTRAGNNNGALAINLNATWNGGGEHAAVWQHLRAAGYISGDPSLQGVASQPRNAFGGLMGLTTANSHNNLRGLKMCMSQVPGKAAAALDLQLDDGAPRTGDLRANQGVSGQNTNPTNANPPAAYSEDQEYTMCKRI